MNTFLPTFLRTGDYLGRLCIMLMLLPVMLAVVILLLILCLGFMAMNRLDHDPEFRIVTKNVD